MSTQTESAAIPTLREALQAMLDEKADYMRRNNLGNPYLETTTKMAVAALAATPALPVPGVLTDERIDIDSIALATATKIMEIRWAGAGKFGRYSQLKDQIQCEVRDAMAARWISVDDVRKPEPRKPVLLFVRTLTHGQDDDGNPLSREGAEVSMGEWLKYDDGGHFECYTSPMSDSDFVTHWTPLPDAPTTTLKEE